MPAGTKVARCVKQLIWEGYDKATAIAICQKSTGESYATGEKIRLQKGDLLQFRGRGMLAKLMMMDQRRERK
jgi:hypothetical protein